MSWNEKHIRWVCLTASIVALAMAARGQGLPATTQPDTDHGATIGNVRLTVAMENKELKIGEPVVLDVFVDNFSNQSRMVLLGPPENVLVIVIRDSKGKAVPWTRLGTAAQVTFPGGGGEGDYTAHPMTSSCYRLRLDELADLTEEGAYTASVNIKIPQGMPFDPPEMWEKTLESNQVTFVMTMPTTDEWPTIHNLLPTDTKSPATRPGAGK